ncbi:MAG: hypothetical protein ACI8UO_000986 [Verrucomicrobiales bacterium]|jgi:hypothetical protein
MIVDWFNALLLTQLVEVPIYLVFARRLPIGKRITYAFCASLITHPIVWLIVLFGPGPFWFLIIIAELWAFGGEAAFGIFLKTKRPLLASFTANVASILVGLATREYFNWP